MHLRVGKQHPDFSLATNLCGSDVVEVGCYNCAAHRDADVGNGGTVHSPDVDVAKFQRVCIGDVFVENYVTLHCVLSNWREKKPVGEKWQNVFKFPPILLGTIIDRS